MMCLLAPISTGRSQPQKEGRAHSGSELIYLQHFQSKMNVAIFFAFSFSVLYEATGEKKSSSAIP